MSLTGGPCAPGTETRGLSPPATPQPARPAHTPDVARAAGSTDSPVSSARIQDTSDDVLLVEHGSLYPALQRLQKNGWITAEWQVSNSNRRAKYYRLTPAGRAQLARENTNWDRLVSAIARLTKPV